MFASILCLLLSGIHLLLIHSNGEIITNPGAYQEIHCGENEDCTIRCTEEDECSYSEFYVKNHNINIECTASFACYVVYIYSSNTTSLNLSFSGNHSASFVTVYSDMLDDNVTTTCGENACYASIFNYYSNQQTTHRCDGYLACVDASIVIGNTNTNSFILECNTAFSCDLLMIMTATTNLIMNINSNDYASLDYPITILTYPELSINSLVQSIFCNTRNCSLDYIVYTQGIRFDFDKSCKASDTLCISGMDNTGNINNDILIIDTYFESISNYDFTSDEYQFDAYSGILLILSHISHLEFEETPVIITPTLSNNESILSIFCIFCAHVNFELNQTQNVLITYPNSVTSFVDCTIYGPSNHFKSQANTQYCSGENTYWLQHTTSIEFINLNYFISIYLGETTNLYIDCNNLRETCFGVDVYSSLDPSTTGVVDLGWDIQCNYNLTDTCEDFFFNFPAVDKICSYTGDNGVNIDDECNLIDEIVPPFDYYLPLLVLFMFLMCLAALASCIDNKRTNSKIDDAAYLTIIAFGFQCVDLVTDVTLCIEMINKYYEMNDLLLGFVAYGSMVFIIIPYIINLGIAANIKKIKQIHDNYGAKIYFERYIFFFITLVVLCGGTYPVLRLLSSRIFAQQMFDTGLTGHHLRGLARIKVFSTVVLENIPQLICQIIYLYILNGKPSNNIILAFIASVLSIVATVMSYLVHEFFRSEEDGYVVEYDLEMIIKHSNNQETDFCLTENDKKILENKKERKYHLKKQLGPSLDTDTTRLELGHVTITKTGCVLHCVHYTLQKEIDLALEKTSTILDIMSNDNSLHLSSLLYVRKLYESHHLEVIKAFQNHFKFDDDNIDIIFHEKFHVNVNKTGRINYSKLKSINNKKLNRRLSELNKLIKEINKKLDGYDANGNVIYDKLIEDGYNKKIVDVAFQFIKSQHKEIKLEVVSIKQSGVTFYEMNTFKSTDGNDGNDEKEENDQKNDNIYPNTAIADMLDHENLNDAIRVRNDSDSSSITPP